MAGILMAEMSLRMQRRDNRVHMIIRQKKDFISMQMEKCCSRLESGVFKHRSERWKIHACVLLPMPPCSR